MKPALSTHWESLFKFSLTPRTETRKNVFYSLEISKVYTISPYKLNIFSLYEARYTYTNTQQPENRLVDQKGRNHSSSASDVVKPCNKTEAVCIFAMQFAQFAQFAQQLYSQLQTFFWRPTENSISYCLASKENIFVVTCSQNKW